MDVILLCNGHQHVSATQDGENKINVKLKFV